jgi:hypothetical protein
MYPDEPQLAISRVLDPPRGIHIHRRQRMASEHRARPVT